MEPFQDVTKHLERVCNVVHFSAGKFLLVFPWPQVVYFLMFLAEKKIILYQTYFTIYTVGKLDREYHQV